MVGSSFVVQLGVQFIHQKLAVSNPIQWHFSGILHVKTNKLTWTAVVVTKSINESLTSRSLNISGVHCIGTARSSKRLVIQSHEFFASLKHLFHLFLTRPISLMWLICCTFVWSLQSIHELMLKGSNPARNYCWLKTRCT